MHDVGAAGFTVTAVSRKLMNFGIEFYRVDACDENSAADFTRAVIAIVNEHSGSYDGWSSNISQ